jgi:hypothetical protein
MFSFEWRVLYQIEEIYIWRIRQYIRLRTPMVVSMKITVFWDRGSYFHLQRR